MLIKPKKKVTVCHGYQLMRERCSSCSSSKFPPRKTVTTWMFLVLGSLTKKCVALGVGSGQARGRQTDVEGYEYWSVADMFPSCQLYLSKICVTVFP